jgi:hypothetical protein
VFFGFSARVDLDPSAAPPSPPMLSIYKLKLYIIIFTVFADSGSSACQILSPGRPRRLVEGEMAGIDLRSIDGDLARPVDAYRMPGVAPYPGGLGGDIASLDALARLQAVDFPAESAIEGPRPPAAPTIVDAAACRTSLADPIADLLFRLPIGPAWALSSRRSGGDMSGPLGIPDDAGTFAPEIGPGPPGEGDPSDNPADPRKVSVSRMYLTASFRAVVLILTALGLLWWKLDRDGC